MDPIDQLTTDPDISSGQIRLPEPDCHASSTSHAPVSSQDSDAVPSINLTQSTTQDAIPKRVFDPPQAIQIEGEQDSEFEIASPEGGLAHTKIEPDNKRELAFAAVNVPRVAVAERNEALHHQLAELTNLIRQLLDLYGEKKGLMNQQGTEKQHKRQLNEDNFSKSNYQSQGGELEH